MKTSSKVFVLSALFLVLTTPALAKRESYTWSWSNKNHIFYSSYKKWWKKPHATSTLPVSPKPATSTPSAPTVPPAAGESRVTAYVTGYGWPDNTPAGGNISHPVLHKSAGGVGSYSDPITVAVGHSIIGGKDILDYPKGTKVYIPNLRKYFIVEDTCGNGSTPQNGACHTGYPKGTSTWLDVWVGGQGASQSAVYACESAITGAHTAIINPAANYAVVSGPIYSGTCAKEYGDAIVTQ